MNLEEENNNKPSLASQGAWLLFAKIIGFGLSFALPLIVVRTLSKADFGIYQQVFLVIVTVSAILPFGVSMSAFYFLSREKAKQPFYIFNILLFNFVVGGLACLFLNLYPNILGGIFKDAEMTRLAPEIGVVIWLWVFSTFFEIVAVANQEARKATIFIISAQLTKSIFMITAVWYWGTVGAMLNAAMIQAILESTALFVYLNSRFKSFWRSFDKELFIRQLKYALPFGLMSVLWTLQADIHNWFIGNGFTAEEMAIYRAGCFELPLLFLLQESLTSVMIPRMSQLQKEGNHQAMVELTVRAMEKLSLAYFPVYVFFLITAQTFITTLFTKNYADSVPIFLINITLLPFAVFIADPISRAFEHLGRYIVKLRIFIVIGLLLTLYYGIQHFDLRGMMAIVVAAALIDRIFTTIKIYKTVGVKTSDIHLLKNVGKTGLAAIFAGIPTYFVYHQIKQFTPNFGEQIVNFIFAAPKEKLAEFVGGSLTLGFTGLIFGIIYLAAIYFWGVISEDEKAFVRLKIVGIGKYLKVLPRRGTEDLI